MHSGCESVFVDSGGPNDGTRQGTIGSRTTANAAGRGADEPGRARELPPSARGQVTWRKIDPRHRVDGSARGSPEPCRNLRMSATICRLMNRWLPAKDNTSFLARMLRVQS